MRKLAFTAAALLVVAFSTVFRDAALAAVYSFYPDLFGPISKVVADEELFVTAERVLLHDKSGFIQAAKWGDKLTVRRIEGWWLWADGCGVEGWVRRSDVIPHSKSRDFLDEEIRHHPTARAYASRAHTWDANFQAEIADYTDAIRLDPNNAEYYSSRALTWQFLGQSQNAIADLSHAMHLDPKNELIYYPDRARCWKHEKEYDKAIADLDAAISLLPDNPYCYTERAEIWVAKGRYDKALEDYGHALNLTAKFPASYCQLAWFYATCPDSRCRDGHKAIELASKACELWNWCDRDAMDTLAAAFAEAGQFDNAVKCGELLVAGIIEDENGPPIRNCFGPPIRVNLADARKRLALYKHRQPFRDTCEAR